MERDCRFDIMRGIGIILMMLGHIPVEGFAYRVIYSFHMPMFFLLSGYFANNAGIFSGGGYSHIKKLSQRLLLPFVITIIGIVLIQIGVCVMQGKTIHVGHVMGPLWFLPALWWARMVMGGINHIPRYALWVAFGIGLLAYIVSIWSTNDKVFVLQGLCAIPFIAIGQWVRYNKLPWWMLVICVIAWVSALCLSHMDMHGRTFGCWPLDIIGACGGTWVLFKIVDGLSYMNWVRRVFSPIAWMGQFSLAMMCMHGLEWKALLPIEEMIFEGNTLLILRFVVTLVLAVMVVYLPLLRKIFR